MIGETTSPTVPPEATATEASPEDTPKAAPLAKEHGGRDGPEPTRYGDWEKNGRCIDF